MNFSVVDENEIRLVINNVVQEPGTGKAYTASGTTLTLASALTNGTDEMYCVFLGKARETVTVPTITKDKLNLISERNCWSNSKRYMAVLMMVTFTAQLFTKFSW